MVALLSIIVPFLGATSSLHGEEKLDLTYAVISNKERKLDLYLPKKTDLTQRKPPLVVWIHGGGFKAGSRKKVKVLGLLKEGFAVASISYRLSGEAVFPAQIHDCKAAIRWLRSAASTLSIDASRIGVIGHSAGGMLSALLGASGNVESLEGQEGESLDTSSEVQAVVNMSGGTDYPLFNQTKPGFKNIEKLLGGPVEEKMELAKLASPVTHIDKEDPPFLIIHGAQDKLIPVSQAESLHQACEQAGVQVKLLLLKGVAHSYPVSKGKLHSEITTFFKEHLQN